MYKVWRVLSSIKVESFHCGDFMSDSNNQYVIGVSFCVKEIQIREQLKYRWEDLWIDRPYISTLQSPQEVSYYKSKLIEL